MKQHLHPMWCNKSCLKITNINFQKQKDFIHHFISHLTFSKFLILSLFFSLSYTNNIFLNLSLSLYFSISLSLSLSLTVFLFLSVFLYLFNPSSIFLSLCPLYVFLFLYVSLLLSLYLPLAHTYFKTPEHIWYLGLNMFYFVLFLKMDSHCSTPH